MFNTCTPTCSYLMSLIKILGIAGNLLKIKGRCFVCESVCACVGLCMYVCVCICGCARV